MNNDKKKVILISLAADFVASLLFIFALSLKKFVIVISFYFITLLLIICAFLACYNHFKKNKHDYIYLYMMLLNIVLIIIYTVVLFHIS